MFLNTMGPEDDSNPNSNILFHTTTDKNNIALGSLLIDAGIQLWMFHLPQTPVA